MNKSMVKKALIVGAVGGLAFLGFHAQKYVRMFLALRSMSQGEEETPSDRQARDDTISEMLRNGDAIKIRVSSQPDEDDGDDN
jgi:trehalose-6-phosphate synthase